MPEPSYTDGYATSQEMAKHPEFWPGLKFCWVPRLGVTGNTIPEALGSGRDFSASGGSVVWQRGGAAMSASDVEFNQPGAFLDGPAFCSVNVFNFENAANAPNNVAIGMARWASGDTAILQRMDSSPNNPRHHVFTSLLAWISTSTLTVGNGVHCSAVGYDDTINRGIGLFDDQKWDDRIDGTGTNVTRQSISLFGWDSSSQVALPSNCGEFIASYWYDRIIARELMLRIWADPVAPLRLKQFDPLGGEVGAWIPTISGDDDAGDLV